MFIESLKELFTRDLNKLKEEISLYPNEESIWIVEKGISNSAGNLCLHLVGNLNALIGTVIGRTGYVRNRPEEFSLKNIPQKTLIRNVEETLAVVKSSLDKLPPTDLEKDYPLEVLGKKTSYTFFLMHLAVHLDYHLGQINYHRRLLASGGALNAEK
jgi:hypothetical protein